MEFGGDVTEKPAQDGKVGFFKAKDSAPGGCP
jgi:hypothetical protein